MRVRGLLALGVAVLGACDVAELPTAATGPAEAPALEISHAPSGGIWGFRFLPSDPPEGSTPGPFDPGLSPVVRVCRLVNGACGPTVATFTRTSGTGGRRVTVNAAEESYDVDWTPSGASAGQVYRVSVRVGARELGYADVLMISSWWQFFTTDTEEYVPWMPGWTLPVSFRIEEDIAGSIVVSASSIGVGVADGKPLTAQLLDLHGQPMGWGPFMEVANTSAAAGQVAVLDSGLVVGALPGTAVIRAMWEELRVEVPVTVTDNRRPWAGMATPDNQGNRALWGTSATNVFAASHGGVLRWNGAAWAHEEPVRWRSTLDVFGFGAGDVWAVGEAGMILRFDGTAWSALRYDGAAVAAHPLGDFSPPARRITLRGVWGSSASSLFAVGDSGTALRFNGTGWSALPTGTPAALTDVWGTGATNVYATTDDGRLLRFSGTAWAPVAGVQAPGALHAVWGSSASNVYAVGSGGSLYRFDGSAWQKIRLPTRATLYAVWGTSASNVYVGGESGALYRFDGTRWTPEKSPGGPAQLFGLWGTATGDVFAAGAGGLIARR